MYQNTMIVSPGVCPVLSKEQIQSDLIRMGWNTLFKKAVWTCFALFQVISGPVILMRKSMLHVKKYVAEILWRPQVWQMETDPNRNLIRTLAQSLPQILTQIKTQTKSPNPKPNYVAIISIG